MRLGRLWAFAPLGLLAACASAPTPASNEAYHFIPGTFEPGRQPDGNSIFLEAPEGLILIDTGRHAEHQEKLLAFARQSGRPIAAIVNTHWHLDHSGGNAEIRAAYPEARLYTSLAVESALTGFLAKSRAQAEEYLASGQASPGQQREIAGDFAAMDAPRHLRPTDPITGSGSRTIAGRTLDVRLAPHAATKGDVWIFDAASRAVFAGDLVVAMVPFLDTGCPEGWRKALDEIAELDFETLVPGHGDPMSRPAFDGWRAAFNNLLDCAASGGTREDCIAGWRRDAAMFMRGDTKRVDGMVGYYLDSRLRAAPEKRNRYCEGGAG